MQEIQFQSLVQEDPLEEGMETHSSIFTRKILWSKGSVGYGPWGHKESNTPEAAEKRNTTLITLIGDGEKVSVSLEKQSFSITFINCQPRCSACLASRTQCNSYSHNHGITQ